MSLSVDSLCTVTRKSCIVSLQCSPSLNQTKALETHNERIGCDVLNGVHAGLLGRSEVWQSRVDIDKLIQLEPNALRSEFVELGIDKLETFRSALEEEGELAFEIAFCFQLFRPRDRFPRILPLVTQETCVEALEPQRRDDVLHLLIDFCRLQNFPDLTRAFHGCKGLTALNALLHKFLQ